MSGMGAQENDIDMDALTKAAKHLRELKYEIRRWFIASEMAVNLERALSASLKELWRLACEAHRAD